MTDTIPNLSLNDPGPPSPPSDLLSDPIPDRSVISFISPSVPFLFFLCVCVCVFHSLLLLIMTTMGVVCVFCLLLLLVWSDGRGRRG